MSTCNGVSGARELAAAAGRSVVGLKDGARAGSGVVVEADRVLTLASNLRGERVSVAFADGREADAHVVAVDHDRGIALLEVATGDAPLARFPDAVEDPAIGDRVFALADPGGRGLRVTAGAVSSAPQSLRGPRGRMLEGLIEHTAPLPRGSAGGPLLDADGRLLGLNAVRLAQGLILALPCAGIRERLAQGPRPGEGERTRLGVAVVPGRVARRLRRSVGLPDRDGVLVRAVEDSSAAARAGVQRGDLIVALGEHEVASLDGLFAALDQAPLRQPLTLRVVRGEHERELEVTLGQS